MKNNYTDPADDHRKQIELIKSGQKTLNIIRPATINDGINTVSENDIPDLMKAYESCVQAGRIMKFVPASGAATRMAKRLLKVLSKIQTIHELKELVSGGNEDAHFAYNFIKGIGSFGFYDDLNDILKPYGESVESLINNSQFGELFEFVLTEKGLNLSSLPKALLHFHKYGNDHRTAFEEHLVEGINFIADAENRVRIHFTIPEGYLPRFIELEKIAIGKFNKYKFEITYSFQDHQTHSVALDKNNEPKKTDGQLFLRPSGHGALLKNLNDLKADLVHIKNIDNLPRADRENGNYRYKKIMIGYLVKIQKQIFHLLDRLNSDDADAELLIIAENYIKENLHFVIRESYQNYSLALKKNYLIEILNRPIRVCGMIKNTGEPGGGPFWMKDKNGNVSLQIVEQSQIIGEQTNLLQRSTHFNPVDIVCAVRDFRGIPFDLFRFRDEDSYIISKKNINGEELKILEYPGLWNGSMANWNTVFIEIPNSIFAPVKEVNDLLKPVHQP